MGMKMQRSKRGIQIQMLIISGNYEWHVNDVMRTHFRVGRSAAYRPPVSDELRIVVPLFRLLSAQSQLPRIGLMRIARGVIGG